MWEFSVGLYMISVWPNSLLFAAIYGVVESASTAFFGPIVGDLVDKLAYVKVLSFRRFKTPSNLLTVMKSTNKGNKKHKQRIHIEIYMVNSVLAIAMDREKVNYWQKMIILQIQRRHTSRVG